MRDDPDNLAKRPRVLVVEDHADTLAMMGRILAQVPVDAVPVASCAAARRAAATLGGVAMVIADLRLPDGDGTELLAELKRTYGCASVVLTGSPPPGEGVPAWVDLWLEKPTTADEIRRAVGALCPPP
jgi:CheY-like chemotaxis protein